MVHTRSILLAALLVLWVAAPCEAELLELARCTRDTTHATGHQTTAISAFFDTVTLRGELRFTMNPKHKDYAGTPIVQVPEAEVLLYRKTEYHVAHILSYAFEHRGAIQRYSVFLYPVSYDQGGAFFAGLMRCRPTEVARRIDLTTGKVAEKSLAMYTGEKQFFTEQLLLGAVRGNYHGTISLRNAAMERTSERSCGLAIRRDSENGEATATFTYPGSSLMVDFSAMVPEVVDGAGILYRSEFIRLGFSHLYSLARRRLVLDTAMLWSGKKGEGCGCRALLTSPDEETELPD